MNGMKLSRNTVKLIAGFLMTLNHFAYIFMEPDRPLTCLFQYMGYFTAITMCALMTEGWRYTSSRVRYGVRLGVFALVSQIPFRMMMDVQKFSGPQDAAGWYFSSPDAFFTRVIFTRWNMIYSLLLCILFLYVRHYIFDGTRRMVLSGLVFFASIWGDWPGYAVLFVWWFDQLMEEREGNIWKAAPETAAGSGDGKTKRTVRYNSTGQGIRYGSMRQIYVLAAVMVGFSEWIAHVDKGMGIGRSMLYGLGSTSGIWLSMLVMCFFYKPGRRGGQKKIQAAIAKWFFYLYYPAHIFLLVMIKLQMQ